MRRVHKMEDQTEMERGSEPLSIGFKKTFTLEEADKIMADRQRLGERMLG